MASRFYVISGTLGLWDTTIVHSFFLGHLLSSSSSFVKRHHKETLESDQCVESRFIKGIRKQKGRERLSFELLDPYF